MTTSGKSETGCWKIGCIGCGGLAILVVIAGLGVFGVAKNQIQDETIEDSVWTHELREDPTDDSARSIEGEVEASLPILGAPDRIVLDLAHANFEIEPGHPGDPLIVEARYEASSYELEQRGSEGQGKGSEVEIRFRRKGSGWFAGIKEMLGGTRPVVRIALPQDQALDLDLLISQGGARVNLGGLLIRSAEIRFEQGGLDLGFDSPLAAPMESLVIDGSMGGVSISEVGNASPSHLEVICAMGGMHLDLRGPWQNDVDIRVDARMGGAAVRLPKNVRIEGLATSRVVEQDSTELPLPVLRFQTSASMGEIEILE